MSPTESSSAEEAWKVAGDEIGVEFCDPKGESDKLKQGDGETPGPIKSAQGRNSDTPASASAFSNLSASVVGAEGVKERSAPRSGEFRSSGGTPSSTTVTGAGDESLTL